MDGNDQRRPVAGPSGALRASKIAPGDFVERVDRRHPVAGPSGAVAMLQRPNPLPADLSPVRIPRLSIIKTKNGPHKGARVRFIGGVDGTRTRDPRRDRPVF